MPHSRPVYNYQHHRIIMSTRTTRTIDRQQIAGPFCLTQNAGNFQSLSKDMHFPLDKFLSTRYIMLVSNRTTRQPIATALLQYKSCGIFHKSRPNEMYFFTRQYFRPLVRLDNRLLEPCCLQTRTDIF